MPATELQETGRTPPNEHHSMPEDGCRPCSGLDPPMIKIAARHNDDAQSEGPP